MYDPPVKSSRLLSPKLAVAALGAAAIGCAQYLLLTSMPLLLVRLDVWTGLAGTYIAVLTLFALLSRFPAGRIADARGARAGAVTSALLYVGSCAALSVAATYGPMAQMAGLPIPIVIGAMAQGVASGAYLTSMYSFVAEVADPSRRAEALGVVGVAISLGQGLGAALSFPAAGSIGFAGVLGVGAVLAVIAGAAGAGMSTRRDASAAPALPMWLGSRAIVPSVAGATLTACHAVGMAFIPLLALERGLENPGVFFTCVAVVSVVLRFPLGRVADRRGRLSTAVPGMMAAATAMALVAGATSMTTLVLAGILYGIGVGATLPAVQALVMDVTHPRQRGAATATYWATADLASAGSSAAAGPVALAVGLGGLFTGIGAVPLAGMCALLLWSRHRRGPAGVAVHPAPETVR